MKTLTQLYQEIIDDIFRSFSPESKYLLNEKFRQKTKEWLNQELTNLNSRDTLYEGIIQRETEVAKLINEVDNTEVT